MTTDIKPRTGMICVFIAALLWGTTGTAATFAPELSPLAIGAIAMGSGGVLQALIAFRTIIAQRRLFSLHWRYLLVGALAVAVYPLAFYCSMRYAGVAVGTVISIGSAPLLSAIIEYYLDRQRLSAKWLCGAAIGIGGILLLSLSHHAGSGNTDVRVPAGILLGLVAGLTYALYSWSARRLMQRGIAPRAAMGATFGCGGLLLIPVLLLTAAPLLHSWTNAAVGIYMSLVPMFIGYLCYGFGLAHVRASTATTITLLEPVVATLLAVVLVREQLAASGWLGIAMIVLCLMIISLPSGLFVRRSPSRRVADIEAE